MFFEEKIQAQIIINEIFRNSEGCNVQPNILTHLIEPLFSIPWKKEMKIRIIEIKNMKRKNLLIPNFENKEIKKIKKKQKGRNNKCLLTK